MQRSLFSLEHRSRRKDRSNLKAADEPMFSLLESQAQTGWLVEQDNFEFLTSVYHLIQAFAADNSVGEENDKDENNKEDENTRKNEKNGGEKKNKTQSQVRSILIAESDPLRFLASFFAAQATHQRVFLGNPQWGRTEWQQAMAIAQPTYVWGNCTHLASSNHAVATSEKQKNHCQASDPLIMIPTGGSSGTIRFVMHTWQTLAAAVEGFQQYFNVGAVNSICVLPFHHVSGLMQVMRSLISGGKLWLTPFQSLKLGQRPPFDPSEWFISLVPTQLQCLIDQPDASLWLAQCQTVFIGGAPAWPNLLHQARTHKIPVSLCYGMTETAAQIVALRPNDFLAGKGAGDCPTVGQLLPHAHITILSDQVDQSKQDTQSLQSKQNAVVLLGTVGRIKITAKSLALGYYPTYWSDPDDRVGADFSTEFFTDDGGYFDEQGYLTLVGRLSEKIITGGENVFPAEVEAAIWATGLVTDVAVLGMPDAYWGQCVTAVYVPKDLMRSPHTIEQQLAAQLTNQIARFKHPKVWVSVQTLPRNTQGKLNRSQLKTIAKIDRQLPKKII